MLSLVAIREVGYVIYLGTVKLIVGEAARITL